MVIRLKICFVSKEYPPISQGGAGTYAECLSRELATLGHEVHVISPNINLTSATSIEDGVFVHRVPYLNRRFVRFLHYGLQLRRNYEKIRTAVGEFDVLHGNDIYDFGLAKGLVTVPRVVTIHHLYRYTLEMLKPSIISRLLNLDNEVGLEPFIEKIVINQADRIIAVSNFTKRCLLSFYKVPSSKVIVIHNGVYPKDYEIEDPSPLKEKLGLTNEYKILSVGGLYYFERKGLDVLLKAFRILLNEKRARLIIVGGGKQNPVKALANKLGVNKNVSFTGCVDNLTLRKLYNICDVFVLPSLVEGFGLVLLEAMVAGKPVVASRAAAIPELIKDEVNGKLFKTGDPLEAARALKFLAENPDIAKEIGMRNKKYASENFSWKKTAKMTERVYQELLDHSENR